MRNRETRLPTEYNPRTHTWEVSLDNNVSGRVRSETQRKTLRVLLIVLLGLAIGSALLFWISTQL